MARQLHRGLNNRHIQLIAIGGAIGTGLFLGSGQTISLTGPSLLFTYMIISLQLLKKHMCMVQNETSHPPLADTEIFTASGYVKFFPHTSSLTIFGSLANKM